jgi:DNA-binding transcriptional MocR family regulator
MSQAKREKLLGICQKMNVPIVEDGFEEEMKYMGKIPLSLKAMDKNNIVVYISSFSKVFSTGLRIGWIVSHTSLIKELIAIKRYSDIATSSFIQTVMYNFCVSGYFDKHIKKLNREYKRRMETALKTLEEEIKLPHVEWTKPQGGYLIWFKIRNHGWTESEIMRLFEEHGTNINPGSRFFIEEDNHFYFRLTISKLNEKEIKDGISRLSRALSEFYNTNHGRN